MDHTHSSREFHRNHRYPPSADNRRRSPSRRPRSAKSRRQDIRRSQSQKGRSSSIMSTSSVTDLQDGVKPAFSSMAVLKSMYYGVLRKGKGSTLQPPASGKLDSQERKTDAGKPIPGGGDEAGQDEAGQDEAGQDGSLRPSERSRMTPIAASMQHIDPGSEFDSRIDLGTSKELVLASDLREHRPFPNGNLQCHVPEDLEMKQALEHQETHIAALQQEGLWPRETISEQSKTISEQFMEIGALIQERDALREKMKKFEEERQSHNDELTKKEEMIGRLREKVTAGSWGKVELLGQSPLRRPEGEILRAWQTLAYEVRNFVMNHFKDVDERKMGVWLEAEGPHLREITPIYQDVAQDKRCRVWLAEAALWDVLVRLVFGDSTMQSGACWAGKYAGKISKLSTALSDGIGPDDPGKRKTFHEWKAVTAALVTAIDHRSSYEERVVDITEELDDMLKPIRRKLRVPLRSPLQKLVRRATQLDQSFCGQQNWYHLRYPEVRHGMAFQKDLMATVEDSQQARRVRFVVRPGLYCMRGERRDNFERFFSLDCYQVYTY